MKKGDFRSRIDPKPPLNEETGKKKLERKKLGPTCWREQELNKYFHETPNICITNLYCYYLIN